MLNNITHKSEYILFKINVRNIIQYGFGCTCYMLLLFRMGFTEEVMEFCPNYDCVSNC